LVQTKYYEIGICCFFAKEFIRSRKSKDTIQWPKEIGQKDNYDLQSTTQKTKDWATRTPLKTEGELRFSGRVSSSCSTSDTCCVTFVTNPVISHEWGKDRSVIATNGTYPWLFVTQILRKGYQSHDGGRKNTPSQVKT
jgi:hypothetical protein